jgi:MFS family permease
MAMFIVVSMLALNFVDYSFLSVTTLQFTDDQLANFISYFELAVVVFGFLFQSFATDRIVSEYGIRVAMLVSPVIIAFFTISAIGLGLAFGEPGSEFFALFFVAIATSKLFISSLRDALDNQTFKLYLLPIESSIRIDVQTKIEGLITAFASLLAGGLIILINRVEAFGFTYIIIFTLPIVVAWYFIANRMHSNYRRTLHKALLRNKENLTAEFQQEFTLRSILEKNASSTISSKVIYSLKLMEKLEPVLFENTVIRLATSDEPSLSNFAMTKIKSLGIDEDLNRTPSVSLAHKALGESEDSDLLSIEPQKLISLGKSGKQSDRVLAAKLLRKLTGPKTIFVLLELMRDMDPKVRIEALITARKIKVKETWPLLIETLGSTTYGHYAASALIEAGESVLSTLENAFHKSGQQDRVMLRIVQIIGRIGGHYALKL